MINFWFREPQKRGGLEFVKVKAFLKLPPAEVISIGLGLVHTGNDGVAGIRKGVILAVNLMLKYLYMSSC